MKMTSEQLAWKIRRHGIEMAHRSGGSHIGSILSVADIIAVLYTEVLHFRAADPAWEERDRFILSKGHAGAAVYAALAESGFFKIEDLMTHYQNGSMLSGHVSHHVPGVDFSTGSLGHGIGAAVGMAYAAKKGGKSHRVFVVMGDGECDEGSVWEAALFANHFRLNNLVAIIDRNHMQSLDFSENTLELGDLGMKWRAFGWNVIEIDGNDHAELRNAFHQAELYAGDERHRPTLIVANTVKGYGISFMENDILWHYRFPHEGWEYDCAVRELHASKPEGVEDIYTPEGIDSDEQPEAAEDQTFSHTWRPDYPEKMRRVEAKPGTREREHKL